MELQYSKYFESLLCFFQSGDDVAILQRVKPILNSPADFYYNYNSDDVRVRCISLFEHLFDQYANVHLGGQHYKAMWHLIHTVPLVAPTVQNADYVTFFYEEFLFEHIQCLNCISHYIGEMFEHPEYFESRDTLFDALVRLHNEINASRNKALVADVGAFKEALAKEVERVYPNVALPQN